MGLPSSPVCVQGSSQGHWRFPGHAVEQGYAYILTHPGTPCVFWDHLCDQRTRDTVARLIAIRKRAAIHCRSPVRRRGSAGLTRAERRRCVQRVLAVWI